MLRVKKSSNRAHRGAQRPLHAAVLQGRELAVSADE